MGWDEKLARIKGRPPTERPLRMPLDGGKADEAVETARVHLAAMRAEATRRFARTIDDDADLSAVVERTPEVAQALTALREAEAIAEQMTETLVIRAMPPAEYEALLDAHPPTEAGRARGETYNSTTFAPALVAECCVDPDGNGGTRMTLDQAKELLNAGSAGDAEVLFKLAIAVNQQTLIRLADLGKD